MRSKDPNDYIIVTKQPKYLYHISKGTTSLDCFDDIEKNHSEDLDKTFWIYDKNNGELVGRYSVVSAPKWIMNIYNILVKEQDVQYC